MYSISKLEQLLPAGMLPIYRSDPRYSSNMVPLANKFTDWFLAAGIPFFRFYTDHSEKHSLDVFQSAIEFIAQETYDVISAQDISILFATSFCHDAGMHLTELQFARLIAEDNRSHLSDLDTITWSNL